MRYALATLGVSLGALRGRTGVGGAGRLAPALDGVGAVYLTDYPYLAVPGPSRRRARSPIWP